MPDLAAGLAHPYLQNALAGGLIVAVLGAFVGYFVVLRGAAFATHALSQIGFAGAAGAVLIGIEPVVGLLAFSLLGAAGLGALSLRSRTNDVGTALLLVASLGTGALFLALASNFASNVVSLLFGTIVGVDRAQVGLTAVAAACALALLYATVARAAARSAGVPVVALDFAFLGIVALAAAVTVPIVGALLVFSLMLGPAAAAGCISARPGVALALAVALGAVAVFGGVAAAYETDWPVGFFIATIALLEYVAARSIAAARAGAGRGRATPAA